jgi:histone-lysine N-methyltransferase SETMAR
MRKVTKWVLFLHDNVLAHRALATQKKLAYLAFHFLDHPPYSPDLAPSDYHLFPGLKKTIERSPFFVRGEVIRIINPYPANVENMVSF